LKINFIPKKSDLQNEGLVPNESLGLPTGLKVLASVFEKNEFCKQKQKRNIKELKS